MFLIQAPDGEISKFELGAGESGLVDEVFRGYRYCTGAGGEPDAATCDWRPIKGIVEESAEEKRAPTVLSAPRLTEAGGRAAPGAAQTPDAMRTSGRRSISPREVGAGIQARAADGSKASALIDPAGGRVTAPPARQ